MATKKNIGDKCFVWNIGTSGRVVAVEGGKVSAVAIKTPSGETIINTINMVVLIITAIDKLIDVLLPLVDKISIWWKNRKSKKE